MTSREAFSFLVTGGLLACLALALTYLTDGMFRREVPVSEMELGGRYFAGKGRRRVRVRAIRPGSSVVTLVLEDVDTGDVVVAPFHEGASFERRRFGP